MGRDDLAKVPISMVMTSRSKMIYAEPKEDLVSIAQKMMDYEVDCLPVGTFKNVGNDRKFVLIGRVSKTNITRLFWNWGKAAENNKWQNNRRFMSFPILLEKRRKVWLRRPSASTTRILRSIVCPFIRHTDQIEKIIDEAAQAGAVVCHTLVSPELRADFERIAHEKMSVMWIS